MKAGPERQWRLLDVQALDTRMAQLAHRRAGLPELQELAALARQLEAADTELITVRTAREDLQRDVAKAEADVQLVRDRAARNQARLDAGQGTAKDLQALQHELASLARRQGELEDIQLLVMERAEELEESLRRLEQSHEQLTARIGEVTAARDQALALLDAESAEAERARANATPGVGPDLMALYEKIRAQSGTGAASLRQGRCEGCRLELVGADLQRIRAAEEDEVLRCEECRRILVRTPESGL
jgi:predicted  nucleic acid-binding Zn-ribbon protein